MKKFIAYLFIGLFSIVWFASCSNDNSDEYEEYLEQLEEHNKKVYAQYQADSTLISDYIIENDSVAEFNEDYGFFYHIIEPGSTLHPDKYSVVNVTYKGMLLDGTVFDETEGDESVRFYLSNLIYGWQYGIPLIGTEGKIILYLPSLYGYGETERDVIPANSVLIFEIGLLEFY